MFLLQKNIASQVPAEHLIDFCFQNQINYFLDTLIQKYVSDDKNVYF